ncbi:MAG: DUF1667 domain-containing protein [Clostridia bacterium]|nr:DUF1667 domain-containing protein [Clostridia bacterium]
MTTKTLTCIVCPVGCQLEVTLDEQGKVQNITGNTCKRGYAYAETEFTNPTRTLTSTVKLTGSDTDILLPVRTASPIPKGKLFEAMTVLNQITVSAPVKIGDVVCADLVGTGIPLVACKNVG